MDNNIYDKLKYYAIYKMTLKEMYQVENAKPNPAQVFIERIAEVTCREPSTVRQWLSGTQTPNQKAKERIAKHFGKDVNELFTESETNIGTEKENEV